MPKLLPLRDLTYEDSDGPVFYGQYAAPAADSPANLTVVTYNIDFGLEVDEAIQGFQAVEPLPSADIVLLQEMDEEGTERMARALHANFVYYPATFGRHGRNFGNAVLARLLPHRHPIRKQLRIAARATVLVGNHEVVAYSVHTETYTVPAAHRAAQVAAIVDDIGHDDGPVVVGGDFNTVSRRSIDRARAQFASVGLVRSSAGIGPTVRRLGVQPSAADHIFSRGFHRIATGKAEAVRASDHFPIWVKLSLARDPVPAE
jgi:endonuclease/exonuclease/phosphatase (EEP) superfamily protein YafD